MKTYTRHLLFQLLLTAVLLLTGCSGMLQIGAASPESAAIRYARDMKTANFTINQDSIEVVQKAEVSSRVLVLVQYNGTRFAGGAEDCAFVMETDKASFFGWESHGGGGSCHQVNDPTDTAPVTASGNRGGSSPKDPGYSTVYGLVRDPQITRVVVTWDDGRVQPVEVQSSTYLAAREGGFNMKKIEALNGQNQTVYSTD